MRHHWHERIEDETAGQRYKLFRRVIVRELRPNRGPDALDCFVMRRQRIDERAVAERLRLAAIGLPPRIPITGDRIAFLLAFEPEIFCNGSGDGI